MHTHKQSILESITLYQKGILSLEGIQRNFAIIAGAIEGDMSMARELRKAIHEADNLFEMARFVVDEAEGVQEVKKLLEEIKELIVKNPD